MLIVTGTHYSSIKASVAKKKVGLQIEVTERLLYVSIVLQYQLLLLEAWRIWHDNCR